MTKDNRKKALEVLNSNLSEDLKLEIITKLTQPLTTYKWNQINWWEKPMCREYKITL